ncbi:43775_t:CDS:2 [Gigaspora margarita]|uniref:43775_t:CDS:1 n=1 Tax=Gigaspora margarita TaxID=4874 RepID=A0ABN7VGS1_GIGMA|nr:43775_t:CDS:2 [Gigaspora margarita]
MNLASGKINRINRLITWLRAQIPGGGRNPPTDDIDAKPPLSSNNVVLEQQRLVWIKIFANLGIKYPDPNDKNIKSSVLFSAMLKVSAEIMYIVSSSSEEKEVDESEANAILKMFEYGLSVNKEFDFGPLIIQIQDPQSKDEGNLINKTVFFSITKRIIYTRLFQGINTKQKNLVLNDIAIQFKLTLYHNEQCETRVPLPVSENFAQNGGLLQITPVLNPMVLKFFIIEICDKHTAILDALAIGNIILDRNIQDIQFCEYIEPVVEAKLKIECKGCELQNHEKPDFETPQTINNLFSMIDKCCKA